MISCRNALYLLGVVTLVSGTAVAQDQQVDEVTQQLFEQYVARSGKIETESVMAATHLVAERGRNNGFWRNVLEELQRNDQKSEIGCVRVLGKMLATDAAARDAIRRHKETGEVSQWVATVRLAPEVVNELLERGRKADRFHIDDYTIALARARTSEARDFFKSILRATREDAPFAVVPPPERDAPEPPITDPVSDKVIGFAPTAPYHSECTRFHAAVGLAQLGDSEGIDWLIENCESTEGSVERGRPVGAHGSDLGDCCVGALRQLTNKHALTDKVAWAAWSKSAGTHRWLDHAVVFDDP
jgi:hypothetical protein